MTQRRRQPPFVPVSRLLEPVVEPERELADGIPGLLPCLRVATVLEQVGMERRAEDPVRELSRGMLQRLAVARAVLHDPPLLLLDEPRANLDPAAAELLEPLLGRASGRTRVLVSHDVAGALGESDVVLRLKRGRPVGADEELYR